MPEAWKLARGKGVTIAVLDTGVDANHPDLVGQFAAPPVDFTGSPRKSFDVQGHGTHVCGTIAASDNATGVIGVAPEAKLLMAKVLGDDGSGFGDWIARGIDWACEQGADVLSLSLGSREPDPQIQAALLRAVAAGKFVVAAAGNDGQADSVGYPAAWDDLAVAVAAIDEHGQLAGFSSLGRQVDVAAPGVNILSCWPGGGYSSISGTSMATPFVTGSVALLLSACRAAGHGCPKDQADLVERIHQTSDDAGIPGPDTGFGWGLIDPAKLIASLGESPSEPPLPAFSVEFPTTAIINGRRVAGAMRFVAAEGAA